MDECASHRGLLSHFFVAKNTGPPDNENESFELSVVIFNDGPISNFVPPSASSLSQKPSRSSPTAFLCEY
jgi:hypothetical protein